MSNGMMSRKLLVGCGLGGLALIVMLAAGNDAAQDGNMLIDNEFAAEQQSPMTTAYGDPNQPQPPMPQQGGGTARLADVRQALAGLARIRQQQCQSGNQQACQVLPQMPGYDQQLMQMDQGCRSGDSNACGAFDNLSQRIFTAYSESAAVMQAGEAGMAQMDAWRAQMNRNAANSMANLQARAAAGQAAHSARQESNAAMNRSWEAGQASAERNHGRFVDGIYGGTTMDGGGVQSRVPYGSRGYTDGNGNVVAVPDGGRAPDGWQAMDPTYAAGR